MRSLIMLGIAVGLGPSAKAAPIDIVSALTPIPSNGTTFSGISVAVSFSTANTYSDVEISVITSGNATVGAYLTTQIGPGTLPSDEIVFNEVTFPDVTFAETQVLSIPSLSPGTYYLVLNAISDSANIFGDATGTRQVISTARGPRMDLPV